jgi:hypothetical protein
LERYEEVVVYGIYLTRLRGNQLDLVGRGGRKRKGKKDTEKLAITDTTSIGRQEESH